jgi:hypothetical protein
MACFEADAAGGSDQVVLNFVATTLPTFLS